MLDLRDKGTHIGTPKIPLKAFLLLKMYLVHRANKAASLAFTTPSGKMIP